MKHALSLLILVICASTSFAQTTDSVAPKLDPNTKKVLNIQDQSAYQLAMRYNDFQAAKDKLFSLIIRNPEDLRYPELLGSLYFENEMATSAALVALDILQVNDKSIGSLEIAAFSLEQLGALDRALPHFERLYLLTGDNFSLYKSAFIQYNLKKYQEALNSVNMLSKNTKPEDKIGFPLSQTETQEIGMKAAALNLKGMIYLDQGSKAEAKTAFEEAIQLEPNFNLAKENLKKAM
jgi:tetratricopeptide (TPR) repeat protein